MQVAKLVREAFNNHFTESVHKGESPKSVNFFGVKINSVNSHPIHIYNHHRNHHQGSPFEGGVFKLELFLPEDYPMTAPKVKLYFVMIAIV